MQHFEYLLMSRQLQLNIENLRKSHHGKKVALSLFFRVISLSFFDAGRLLQGNSGVSARAFTFLYWDVFHRRAVRCHLQHPRFHLRASRLYRLQQREERRYEEQEQRGESVELVFFSRAAGEQCCFELTPPLKARWRFEEIC